MRVGGSPGDPAAITTRYFRTSRLPRAVNRGYLLLLIVPVLRGRPFFMSVELETLLSRLDKVQGRNGKYKARCPAHDDRGPSLSVTETDNGQLLIHCFAGCGAAEVIEAIGLQMRDLFPKDDFIQSRRYDRKPRPNYRLIVENARHAAVLVHIYAAKIQSDPEWYSKLGLDERDRIIFEGVCDDLRVLIDA